MGVTLTWFPSPDPNVDHYTLESGPTETGSWTLVVVIGAQQSGPNWDPATGQYVYVHAAGTLVTWYRISSTDIFGTTSAPSSSFQPSSTSPVLPAEVRVNQDYPTMGNLRYRTAAGVPIELATIRVFYESDFNTGNTTEPLATTQTNAQGNWVSPVYLLAGYNYVIQFAREGLYGPDLATITV